MIVQSDANLYTRGSATLRWCSLSGSLTSAPNLTTSRHAPAHAIHLLGAFSTHGGADVHRVDAR